MRQLRISRIKLLSVTSAMYFTTGFIPLFQLSDM